MNIYHFGRAWMHQGTAEIAVADDPDVGTAVVDTGLVSIDKDTDSNSKTAYCVWAVYNEDPGTSTPIIVSSVSGGTVTFTAGNLDGITISWFAIGH